MFDWHTKHPYLCNLSWLFFYIKVDIRSLIYIYVIFTTLETPYRLGGTWSPSNPGSDARGKSFQGSSPGEPMWSCEAPCHDMPRIQDLTSIQGKMRTVNTCSKLYCQVRQLDASCTNWLALNWIHKMEVIEHALSFCQIVWRSTFNASKRLMLDMQPPSYSSWFHHHLLSF